MVMLNHLSRAGSESHCRSAEPKPAQVETLGTLTSAKTRPTTSTFQRWLSPLVYVAIAATAITQALGFTH